MAEKPTSARPEADLPPLRTTPPAAPWRALVLHALWAALLGLVSGLAAVAARLTFKALQWCFTAHNGLLPSAAAALPNCRRALVPVLGAACAWLVLAASRRYARRIPHPAPFTDYIDAVRSHHGVIPIVATCWRTASSAFSVSTGAAIGREGSMIQFASACASSLGVRLGPRLRLDNFSLEKQVACGTAAAVAVAYQAPIAGVLFAAEIVLGELAWANYPMLATAASIGWLVSRPLLGYVGYAGLFEAPAPLGPVRLGWLWLPALAVLLGVAGPLYQQLIRGLRHAAHLPLALLWGGLAVGLLSLARPAVWGNGDAALLTLVHTSPIAVPGARETLLLLLLRLFATSLCVGVGTVGGVFTPTLFAGAAVGLLAAHLVHATVPLLFVLVGLASLLAAVTHAPWMASFMAVELTGRWELFPVLLLSALVACQIAKRIAPDSLYRMATTSPLQPRPQKDDPVPPPGASGAPPRSSF